MTSKIIFKGREKFILTILLVLTLLSFTTYAKDVVLSKTEYPINEIVSVELIGYGNEIDISIRSLSTSEVYKFLGNTNEIIQFYPKSIGEYVIEIAEQGQLVQSINFVVIDPNIKPKNIEENETTESIFDPDYSYIEILPEIENKSVNDSVIEIDKDSYKKNESVNITINDSTEFNSMLIISENEAYTFFGSNEKNITFIPKSSGHYEIILKDLLDGTISNISFDVVEEELNESTQYTDSITSNETEEQVKEIKNITNLTLKDIISNVTNETSGLKKNLTDFELENLVNDEENINIESLEKKFYNLKKKIKIDGNKFNIKNNKNSKVSHKIKFYNKVLNDTYSYGDDVFEGVYDVEIEPTKHSIKKITLFNLNYSKDINLGIDDIKDRIIKIKDKKSIKQFAVDPASLEFDSGVLSSIATGTELWKCEEWDFTNQNCLGTWKKIKDLYPGEEYSILINSTDPAFIETGVATVNSKKPIYHPSEDAELIMVVLNTLGYPVSGANVDLTITDPNGNDYLLSTSNSEITEKSKGVYRAVFKDTFLTGRYDLLVTATGPNVNSNLTSHFAVKNYYEFDIIRNIPSTINPLKGPFRSEIYLKSNVQNITTFDFSESLPIEFEIINSGGASSIIESNGRKILTWRNVQNNSEIFYEVQAPNIIPEIYELGESYIEYGSNTFYEERVWYIAIDPPPRNGLFVYRDTTDDSVIRYRIWNGSASTLEAEQNGPDLGNPIITNKIRCMKEDYICLYLAIEENNQINFLYFNFSDSTWSTTTVLGTQNDQRVAFDVECEDLSGDCLIVYEQSTAGNDVFAYRIFSASTLSLGGENTATFSTNDNTDYEFLKLFPKYNSDEMGILLKSDGNDQTAGIWDGSSFGNEQALFDPSGVATRLTSDCAWEGSSGEMICFYGRNVDGMWAYEWDGVSTWTDLGQVWDAVDLGAQARLMDACGEDPFTGDLTHDKLVLMSLDQDNDRDGTWWNGTGLEIGSAPTQDGSSEASVYGNGRCMWEHDGATAILAWVDGGQLTPEWGTFTESSNTFSFSAWSSGTTTGMPTWGDDVESLIMELNPDTDEMIITGHSHPTGGSTAECGRWTGATFSDCGTVETSLNTNTAGALEWMKYVHFDWVRFEDNIHPNVTLIAPLNDTTSVINSLNFTWTVVDNKDRNLLCNLTIDSETNQSNINSKHDQLTNFSVDDFTIGEHSWNVTCWDDMENTNTSQTFIFVIPGPPVISIISVGGDTTSKYEFTDETPIVRASIDVNSTCYISELDETYTEMVTNGRVNCGSYTRNVQKDCEYTEALTIGLGDDNLYMACNSIYGDENDASDNADMLIRVLCDAHSDCGSSRYCRDSNQQCELDELTGFSCETVGIGGVPDDEVCRRGPTAANPTALCINDSSYAYTGWYCSSDDDDCVYNNGGNSYDLNYILCNATSNDYKQCGVTNLWGSLFDCGDLNEGFDQNATASTHSGDYCGYWSAAQTCNSGDTDSGSYGCTGGTFTDCGSYIYSGGGSCGSVSADCDVGCGSVCDVDNSTTPEILSDICYYDRSCTNACAWDQSSEGAPEFCINDQDGGTCFYNNRTNATSQETCYYSRECQNSYGANLTQSGILRQDYCDFCNESGNYTGQYAPAPNASCDSDCANSGTIYYDSAGTPTERGDDCNTGISTILSDTLSIGDVWNGSAPAVCNNTECDSDCGSMVGVCSVGVCGCTDQDNPTLFIFGPDDNSWDNDGEIDFSFNVSDLSSGIENCSLIVEGLINLTNTSIDENRELQGFNQTFDNGQYNWSIICYDDSTDNNFNQSSNRTIGIDTTIPILSNPNIDGTLFNVNDVICLNISVSDTFSGLNKVLSNIERPGLSDTNISLSDSSTTSCDATNGDGIYSVEYTLLFSGQYNWSIGFGEDNAQNTGKLTIGLDWNVSEGGLLNSTLIDPSTDLEINESDGNNFYNQTCTVSCISPVIDCENVTLYAQYDNGTGFTEITTTTTELINDEDSYFCGNLSSLGMTVSANTQAESHEQALTTTSVEFVLDNSYNTSKAFITTQTQLSGVTTRDMRSKHATVQFTGCTGEMCENVTITRYNTVYNAYSSFNILQSDIIDVLEFTITWGVSEGIDTYDISSWDPKPPTLSEIQNKCFIQGAGNFRLDSADTDCNAASKVRYYFSDANTIVGERGWGEDCTDSDGVSYAYLVCFNDGTTVYDISQNEVDLESSISNYGIGATIDQSSSFITCNWNVNDGTGTDDADGIEANNMYYEISSSSQIGVSRSQLGTTEATLNFTCHVIEFDAQESFNGAVDQDILDRTPAGEIANQVLIDHDLSSAIELNSTIPICSFGFDTGEGVAHERGEWSYYFLDSDTIRLRRGRTGNSDPSNAIVCQAITFPNETTYYNYSNPDISCSHTFNITSGYDSGNNTWPVQCRASSTNSATVFSDNISLIINDHPVAQFYYPTDGTWLTGIIDLNVTNSFDTDGSIVNYTFEYDNNSNFDTPQIICDTYQENCTWNTILQDQCDNNSMSCYLRINVTDDDGLENSTFIIIGFDTNGPTSVLDLARDFENITTNTFSVNATVTDNEIGQIDVVYFEFRENDTAPWQFACQDVTGASPYNCTWDVTSLSDGDSYELRVSANDTFGNVGNYDIHTNITIDRTEPTISLIAPSNGTWTKEQDMTFNYSVTDLSGVSSCELIFNSVVNQTFSSIQQGENNFTVLNINDGQYNWSVNCTDIFGVENSSITWGLSVDKTGPISTLDEPDDFENISGVSFTVIATVTDGSGIGVNMTTFEYRENDTAIWKFVCEDDRDPYQCTWDISSLSDSDSYELRVWANDSLGNNGSFDTNTNITIDNNGPAIILIDPSDGSSDGDGNVQFSFTVSDTVSGIENCSIYFDGTLNDTIFSPPQETLQIFNISNIKNGNYDWNITCFDDFYVFNQNTSETRSVTIDIRFDMYVEVYANQTQYQIGTKTYQDANFTTNVTGFFGNSLDNANVTNDIVFLENTTEKIPAWWNMSWHRRKAIYVSSDSALDRSDINIQVNVTGLNGYISNCQNEIRVIDENLTEKEFEVLDGDDSTFCDIVFKGNSIANNVKEDYYFVYYNASTGFDPGYDLPVNSFAIHFTGFEADSTTPYDGWVDGGTDTIRTSAVADYCSDTLCPGAGSWSVEVQDDSTTSELYQSFDLTTPCDGQSCEQLNFSFWIRPNSFDAVGEGWDVFCDHSDAEQTNIAHWEEDGDGCYVINGVTVCEDTWTEVIVDLVSSGCTIDSSVEIMFTGQESAVGLGNADQIYIDGPNLTGYSLPDVNITTSVGDTQTWINRTVNTTDISGVTYYIWNTSGNQEGNYSSVSLADKVLYTDAYNHTFFEILFDNSPPNVTLNSPENGSGSNSSVTFTYLVNDTLSSITNCSLFIDNTWESEDLLIQEDVVQFFFPKIPSGGPHDWNVSCTDFYNNTGTSVTWIVVIVPPDLVVNSTDIFFNNTNPIAGLNVTINATVFNIGGSDATNAIIQFWLGHPLAGGVQIENNITVNLTDVTGNTSNVTVNVSWEVPGPGPFTFYVFADPPVWINGSISEQNETNNEGNATLNVSAYNLYYGNISGLIVLDNAENESHFYWNYSNDANIFAIETGSIIDWENIQALSRNVSLNYRFDDFNELDGSLNMTGFRDSINETYTKNDLPVLTANFTVFGFTIEDVPIINSTNNSNFVTGIFWDVSDGGYEYNGSQDLIFATKSNEQAQGQYGIYDYEILVPVNLNNHKISRSTITLYIELI